MIVYVAHNSVEARARINGASRRAKVAIHVSMLDSNGAVLAIHIDPYLGHLKQPLVKAEILKVAPGTRKGINSHGIS